MYSAHLTVLARERAGECIRDCAAQAAEPEHVLLVHRERLRETLVEQARDRVHVRCASEEAREHRTDDQADVVAARDREERESEVCESHTRQIASSAKA